MDKKEDTKSVSKARRNLIKASAAAPIVASLHPGAAMAQSSVQACTGPCNDIDRYKKGAHEDLANRVEALMYITPGGHKLFDLGKTVWFNHEQFSVLYPINYSDTHHVYYLSRNNGKIYDKDHKDTGVTLNHCDEHTVYVLVGYHDPNDHDNGTPWPLVEIDGHNYYALSASCASSSVNPNSQYNP